MLEVEPTGRPGRTADGSGRNGNEVVAGAASEAFARFLHGRYVPVELPSAGTYRFTSRYLVYSVAQPAERPWHHTSAYVRLTDQ